MTINKHELILGLVLSSTINFFYLLPGNFSIGSIGISDLSLLIMLAYTLYVCVAGRSYYPLYGVIVVGLLLIVTSSFQSYYLYSQPLSYGLRSQRMYLACCLLYFPITKLINMKKLSYRQIANVITVCGFIQVVLYFLQFFIETRITIIHVMYNYRYGTIRLYGSTLFPNLMFAFSVSDLLNGKDKKKNLFNIVIVLAYILIIKKGRMLTLTYIAAILFAILIWKNKGQKKLLVSAVGLVALFLFLNSSYINSIVEVLTVAGTDGALDVRIAAQKFYLSTWFNHPLFGGGYINTQWTSASNAAGIDLGYYVVDNGIYGFLFEFGTVGLCWVLILLYHFLKHGIYSLKKCNNYTILVFFFINIVSITTNSGWYHEAGVLSTVLMLVLCNFAIMDREGCLDEWQGFNAELVGSNRDTKTFSNN